MTCPRRTIVCSCCRTPGTHGAHGWCQPCYRRWRYHGRPADGPPPVRTLEHDEVVGTVQGWSLHRRHGTKTCQPCRDAHSAEARANYKQRARLRRQRRYFTDVPAVWSGEQGQAARTVAHRTASLADCQEILQALGLVSYDVAAADWFGGAA